MPTAPILPRDKRPPIRETPLDLSEDGLATSLPDAIDCARSDAVSRNSRQQVSRRFVEDSQIGQSVVVVSGGYYWVIQDVR